MATKHPVEFIELPSYGMGDVTVVEPIVTLGLPIVGQAQSGKTTLKDIVCETWRTFDPEGESLPFTNSNGFRGLTYAVLEHYGRCLDEPVPEPDYQQLLAEFTAKTDLKALLHDLYSTPPDESLLRNDAVNSVVAVTSEDEITRPVVNEVGAAYLSAMLANPEEHGLPETPGLVILDARNREECETKFSRAGVVGLGCIVLTCPEEIVASRKTGGATDSPEALKIAASLQRRNEMDRRKRIGRMTMPEDFTTQYVVDELMQCREWSSHLYEAGIAVFKDPDACFVVRTDRLTLEEERAALDPMIAGLLHNAYQTNPFA